MCREQGSPLETTAEKFACREDVPPVAAAPRPFYGIRWRRPFRRRLLKTRRPFFVDILLRNPCTRFPLMLDLFLRCFFTRHLFQSMDRSRRFSTERLL